MSETVRSKCLSKVPADAREEAPKHASSDAVRHETDGRSAWLTLLASVYIVSTLICLTPVFGVLFSKRLPQLGIGPHSIGWIFTVHAMVWSSGIMLTNSVIARFGYRKPAFVGSFLLTVSFILLSTARTTAHFILLYGFMIPITGSISATVPYLLVPRHFKRRQGLAFGVLATSISLGGTVTPLLIRFLQDSYGFAGACLIHGGILLNCCVAASLLQLPVYRRDMSEHHLSEKMVSGKGDFEDCPESNNKIEKLSQSFRAKLILRRLRHNELFNNTRVILTCLAFTTVLTGFFNYLRMVPFVLESRNFSKQFTAQCISTVYITSTVVRGTIALTSDQTWFNRRYFLIGGVILSSICTLGLVFVPERELWVRLLMVAFGLGFGTHMGLYHVNCVDTHGVDLYSKSVTISAAFQACGYFTIGFVLDWAQRAVAGFGAAITVCAALQMTAGVLWGVVFRMRPKGGGSPGGREEEGLASA